MNLEAIDKNLVHFEYKGSDKMKEISILEKPFSVHGMFYENREVVKDFISEGQVNEILDGSGDFCNCFARVPYEIVKQLSFGWSVLSSTTAGGRIKFSTNSNVIGVSVKWNYLNRTRNMPMSSQVGFLIVEEKDDGTRRAIKTLIPFPFLPMKSHGFAEVVDIREHFCDKQTKMRNFIIYCPLYNEYITDIKVIVEKDARVESGKAYKDIKPIVYYGSSITQGGAVSRADNVYSAHIERWTNVDFVNLGASGSAMGEPLMAEYAASINSSIFVCDYDHNAPTVEFLRNTHYNFYKTYRNIRPKTPIIFMSKPVFDSGIEETNERFQVIKATYDRARKEGDQNVYLVDGRKFYTDRELGESCHVDFSHPNDLGHLYMAKSLYKVIKKNKLL